MQNIVFIVIICIALLMSVFIGVYALFRNDSKKRNYFLLMQTMIVVCLFGYLLELTGTTVREANTGVKVLYTGFSFIGVFVFLYICDYCGVKVHELIRIPMLVLAMTSAVIIITMNHHTLIFRDYRYDNSITQHLMFTPGSLFPLIRFYPVFCMVPAIYILLRMMKVWEHKYRRQLVLFLGCLSIPFLTEGFYTVSILTGINKGYIYFTPISLAVMSFCLYLGIIRFNIFDIISFSAETAIEHIMEGFILVDKDNNYLASNRAAANIFPELSKNIKGQSIFSLNNFPGELPEKESHMVEFSVTKNQVRYYRAKINHVLTGKQSVMAKIILLNDITDSVNLMKELENAAYVDALTGIYNRKHFSELAHVEVERAFRQNQTIYTAMLDLDFFKKVNDTYGHAAGDIVLRDTAHIIRQTIRSYDLLGRYGGEEFVMLITDLEIPEAVKLIERIRENIEQSTFTYEEKELKITCSIGLARYNKDDTLENSIKKSDAALYAAKRAGRNRVMIYDVLVETP